MDREAYLGARVFSVTIATWQRRRPFTDEAEVSWCQTALGATAERAGFRLLAYCFMPDHLHLLVEGSEGSDLSRFIKTFKQETSFEYKSRVGEPLWQRSYHDHVLRSERDIGAAAQYILDNPVVGGLVDSSAEYPFSGGEVLEAELVAT